MGSMNVDYVAALWTLQFTEEQVSVQHLEIANLTNSISLISYDSFSLVVC